MSNILSIKDLNTSLNHEPRMHEILIAEKLGYERPADIKELIERNKDELSNYGEVFRTIRKTGKRGGRPGEDVWLNEGQALVICALSRTPKAAYVRKSIIDVFMDYRRGNEHGSPEHKERVVKVLNDMMAHTVYLQRQLADTYDVMREVDVHSMNAIAARWMAERMQGEIHGVIEGLGEIANVLFKFSRACSKKPRVK